MDDDLLVREFKRTGNRDHFAALVERHQTQIFRLIASILGPGHQSEAEEVTQDVFLKVYKKIESFRGDSKFSSWLYRIAYNQAISHRSQARFRLPHLSDEVLEMKPTEEVEKDPLQLTIDAHTKTAVQRGLSELPKLYLSVLRLRYWMGMTIPEISSLLDTPEGTIKSYLHRARAKLSKQLIKRGITNA